MQVIEITDDFSEQVRIGRHLTILPELGKYYPHERIQWMRDTLHGLITPRIARDFSEEDLLYHSVYDYWVYGNDIAEEIYYHFPYKTHFEKKEYVTLRTRWLWMYSFVNNKNEAYIFNDKAETYKRFGAYFLRDVIKIASGKDFREFALFAKKHPIFVFKPVASGLGVGVQKIDVSKFESAESCFKDILEMGRKFGSRCFNKETTVLLEEVIEQDEGLARIHPYSVNGIRVTTFRKDGKVKILYPWFKVGANKAFVTSAAFGTYDAGIDPETGIVDTDGYKENGEHDAIHPLTGFAFKGYKIPQWEKLICLAKELALSLPGSINYVGWDFVLTPKGWCIMEGNFCGDFMWQMFREKGFRREWERISGVKFEKEFWWQYI